MTDIDIVADVVHLLAGLLVEPIPAHLPHNLIHSSQSQPLPGSKDQIKSSKLWRGSFCLRRKWLESIWTPRRLAPAPNGEEAKAAQGRWWCSVPPRSSCRWQFLEGITAWPWGRRSRCVGGVNGSGRSTAEAGQMRGPLDRIYK